MEQQAPPSCTASHDRFDCWVMVTIVQDVADQIGIDYVRQILGEVYDVKVTGVMGPGSCKCQ